MLDAMLTDLLDISGVEVVTTRDARLPPLSKPVKTRDVHQENVYALWQECMDEADAVWCVAPESGGVLEQLARMASSKWLGCGAEAIRITSSKRKTAQHLARFNIPVVPTYLSTEFPSADSGWVAKSDDGVGCEDMRVFYDEDELRAWLKCGRMQSRVVQPWLHGEAASISMLCRHGKAQLLSCNRQWIKIANGDIHYQGSQLNGMAAHWTAFEAMAAQVAAALPDLGGYVGVDVMVHDGCLTVMEINPRLTTSYAGLRRAIEVNPAELVLDLHYNGRFIEAERLMRNVVEVSVDD